MALERQTIERKDFPLARRGYDPDAVDAHLRALADEIEELKRAARAGPDTLASAVSEQVRAIVAAAETGAAEIRRQAEAQAREIEVDATAHARRTRERASTRADDCVRTVSEAAAGILHRLDAMRGELSEMIDSLRAGATGLGAGLESLERDLGELRAAVGPRPAPPRPETERQTPERHLFADQTEAAVGSAAPSGHGRRADGTEAPDTAAHQDGNGFDDSAGARLVALNMALGGTPREETDRYLAENFRLADRARLLDDVYSSLAR